MFYPDYPIDKVVGATYNPRRITEESMQTLRYSVSHLGVVKPVIITEGNIIVAGHQRTKAMRAEGFQTAPVFQIKKKISLADEIHFNQLHNGSDLDTGEENCFVPASDVLGYSECEPGDVTANWRSKGATVRNEVAKLLNRYGNWGGCVATQSGRVLTGAPYAMACAVIGFKPRIYYVPDHLADEVIELFGIEYGVFSYEHLPKAPSLQTFAQPFRFRNENNPNRSMSYEDWLIPNLKTDKSQRMLDFGCGQGDYVRVLRKRGFSAFGIEFFFRKGNNINTHRVHKMIEEVEEDLYAHGLYDHVMCDFVVNSVVSQDAEDDVLTIVNAMCRPGGTVYFSGRLLKDATFSTKSKGWAVRGIEYFDHDGFTGQFHHGGWFYQKHHSREQAEALAARWFNEKETRFRTGGQTKWMHMTTKTKELSLARIKLAIEREFNIEWPAGKTVNRHREIYAAWRAAFTMTYGAPPEDVLPKE